MELFYGLSELIRVLIFSRSLNYSYVVPHLSQPLSLYWVPCVFYT